MAEPLFTIDGLLIIVGVSFLSGCCWGSPILVFTSSLYVGLVGAFGRFLWWLRRSGFVMLRLLLCLGEASLFMAASVFLLLVNVLWLELCPGENLGVCFWVCLRVL